jgi:2-polyprenyl-6-methoxyphenol hydroxylase-like FAD-dependent oxidoreductase
MSKTEVLIVGGSLNGLTAALLLAHHGIRCTVVERHPKTTVQYKLRGLSPRSMEIYRSVGLEHEIRTHRTGDQKAAEIARAPNLASPDVQFLGKPWADMSGLSAAAAETCDQDVLEPILRAHAKRLGAEMRFDTEVVALRATDRDVLCRLRDNRTGHEESVPADYLLACDGVGGASRDALGIARHGPGILQHWMNLIFSADPLEPYLQGKRFTACFVADVNGSLVPREDRWLLALQYDPLRGERPEQFDAERTRALVRKAAGRDDLHVELYDARAWDVGAYVADSFGRGRAFLAGDAAHAIPPTGGFGGNTGIQDVHNLAWKLALVLRGAAAPELLESYDRERRPIAEATLRQALARLAAWYKDIGRELPEPDTIVADDAVTFGQTYRAGALLDDGDSADEPFENPRAPSGRPGTRAPHVTIARRGKQVAVHDLVGDRFLLLTNAGGRTWEAAARSIAPTIKAKLDTCSVKPDDADAVARLQSAYGLAKNGAVLIRPDGIIAWRARGSGRDPERVLRAAFHALLGQPAGIRARRQSLGREHRV